MPARLFPTQSGNQQQNLSRLLQIEELLGSIKESFCFFNKPKDSVFVAEVLQENGNTIKLEEFLRRKIQLTQELSGQSHQDFRIILVSEQRKKAHLVCSNVKLDSSMRNKIENFISTNKVNIVYFLYVKKGNEENYNKYFTNIKSTDQFHSKEFRPLLDGIRSGLEQFSPLSAYLKYW